MDQFNKYQMLLRAEEFAQSESKNEQHHLRELLKMKSDFEMTNMDDSIKISKLKLKAYLIFLKRDKDALINVKDEFKTCMSEILDDFMKSDSTFYGVLDFNTSSTENDYIGTKQNENVRQLAKQLKANFENVEFLITLL